MFQVPTLNKKKKEKDNTKMEKILIVLEQI